MARHTKAVLPNMVARFQQSAASLPSVLLNQIYLKEEKSAYYVSEELRFFSSLPVAIGSCTVGKWNHGIGCCVIRKEATDIRHGRCRCLAERNCR